MKIISGGQTGVDRAALDFAIQHGCVHGGWCPRGRRAEDGSVPSHYELRETDSEHYDERTQRNVLESDATLIVVRNNRRSPGTSLTYDLAVRHNRPVLVLTEEIGAESAAKALTGFLNDNNVEVLNVAGPRESEAPGLCRFVEAVLSAAISF